MPGQNGQKRKRDEASSAASPKKIKKASAKTQAGNEAVDSTGKDSYTGASSSTEGKWKPEARLIVFDEVLTTRPKTIGEWQQTARLTGKTATQVRAQWRQVLLPKIPKAIREDRL